MANLPYFLKGVKMTLENIKPRTTSVATGTINRFYFNFQAATQKDIHVYLKNEADRFATVVPATEYTITLLSRDTYNYGGYIEFTTPPANGTKVIIVRDTAETQENPFETSSGFQADVVEDEFDKLTAIDQENADKLSRVYALDISTDKTNPKIELPQAGYYLKYDENGDIINADPPKDGKDGKDGAKGENGKDGKDGARIFVSSTGTLADNILSFAPEFEKTDHAEYVLFLSYTGELNPQSPDIKILVDGLNIKTYANQEVQETASLKDIYSCYWLEGDQHRWRFRAILTAVSAALNIYPSVSNLSGYATTAYVDSKIGEINQTLDTINGEVI